MNPTSLYQLGSGRKKTQPTTKAQIAAGPGIPKRFMRRKTAGIYLCTPNA
jgi:hypothetical protein